MTKCIPAECLQRGNQKKEMRHLKSCSLCFLSLMFQWLSWDLQSSCSCWVSPLCLGRLLSLLSPMFQFQPSLLPYLPVWTSSGTFLSRWKFRTSGWKSTACSPRLQHIWLLYAKWPISFLYISGKENSSHGSYSRIVNGESPTDIDLMLNYNK